MILDKIYKNWDKYCEQAKKILAAEGIDNVVSISTSRKGVHGSRVMIYIEPIPLTGNKDLIEKLNRIKGFYGNRKLGYDNRYQYEGHIEIQEVSNE